MKRTIILLAIFLFLVSLLIYQRNAIGSSETQAPSFVGKYQLFQGTFTVLDAKNNRADKEIGIFLLDTTTGKVKRYMTGLDKDGKLFEEWVGINEGVTRR